MEKLEKEKAIEHLQKRYEHKKFETEEPILDIGGGEGIFLESQDIKKATIIDATTEKNKKYLYIHADISKKLPLINKRFKTIFITETLEHLKNPLYLLAQVYDLLEDDGTCYISVPYTEIGPEHHHVCRWTKKELLDQTAKLGFISKVIQKRRRFLGFGFWIPHCWLVLSLRKRINNTNKKNIENYKLDLK